MVDRVAKDMAHDVVEGTLRNNPQVVQRWMAGEAGSWGFLAGKSVMSLRRRLGRRLEQGERREVWHTLWARLTALKNDPAQYPSESI